MFSGDQRTGIAMMAPPPSRLREGIRVMLCDPDGTSVSLSFRLEFPYSNNVVEYEALVIGVISFLQMGV